MKYDSWSDKEFFIYGMAFGGSPYKFKGANEDITSYNSLYTMTADEQARKIPSTYSQSSVQNNGSAKVLYVSPQTSLPDDNVYGEAVVTLLRQWMNQDADYEQSRRRNDPGIFDCSSLVSRAYKAVFDSAGLTSIGALFQPGNNALYTNTLGQLFQNYSIMVSVNTADENYMKPGDVILFGSTNEKIGKYGNEAWWGYFLHVYHAAIYSGNGKMIDIRRTNNVNGTYVNRPTHRQIQENTLYRNYGVSNVRIIGRPNLLPYDKHSGSISQNDLVTFKAGETVNYTVADGYKRVFV